MERDNPAQGDLAGKGSPVNVNLNEQSQPTETTLRNDNLAIAPSNYPQGSSNMGIKVAGERYNVSLSDRESDGGNESEASSQDHSG